MKKIIILFAALLILAPGLIFADIVSFRAGYFFPKAESDLWQIEFENMDFTSADYQASTFGFSYEYFLSREISLILGVEGFTKQKMGTYVGYVSEQIGGDYWAFDYGQGFAISHVFSVSSTPFQVGLKLTPMGRRGKFIPYLGGGVGIYLWSVRLQGEMIDFSDSELFHDFNINQDVIGYYVYQTDAREENKITLGFHGFGGIMIPVGNRISIDISFKYIIVKGRFTEAFQGFENFDLSGSQGSIGINYWF